MDGFDQRDGVFHGGLRQYAVTQIEDVSGTTVGLLEDGFDMTANRRDVGQQYHRIQIALNRSIPADGIPAIFQSNSPIESDDRRAALGQ